MNRRNLLSGLAALLAVIPLPAKAIKARPPGTLFNCQVWRNSEGTWTAWGPIIDGRTAFKKEGFKYVENALVYLEDLYGKTSLKDGIVWIPAKFAENGTGWRPRIEESLKGKTGKYRPLATIDRNPRV